MNDTPTLASGPHQAARPGMPVGPADASRRHGGPATLRSIVASWGARIRHRRMLERMLKYNPHLIDDIGLTRRQAEAEIAKPFWR